MNSAQSESGHVDYRWDFPEAPLSRGPNTFPLAFLAPSRSMTDIHGSGPSLLVRDTMKDVSEALNQLGFVTFRYKGSEARTTEDIKALYQKSLHHPGVDSSHVLWLGVQDGGDALIRNYFDFFAIQAPAAITLLSTTVLPLHLNNITCPYLILHGAHDSFLESTPYHEIEAAVHHHQMRYGDTTTHELFPNLGRGLGGTRLDPEVLAQVKFWLAQKSIQRAMKTAAEAA